MSSAPRRLHRLPQHLDYRLIPAPLNLSLPQITEKSPLPAIIVTPSSPSFGDPEYYIAFLTPPKPSLRERFARLSPLQGQFPLRAKTALFIAMLLFILVCHLLAHLSVYRPHFDFNHSDIATHPDSHTASPWKFLPFDLHTFWDITTNGDGRNYIVEELSQAALR